MGENASGPHRISPESTPLRIAMVSYYLPTGSKIGVGYQVHEIADELARRGHEVTVFSECEAVPGARYRHQRVVLPGSLRTFRFALAVRRIDLTGFDVLHAHGDDYWLWRRRVGVHVRTIHGSCFEEARTIKGLKEKLRMILLGLSEVLASLVADHPVVVSPQTRQWLPWVRTVIPNGVDTARFRPGEAKRPVPTVLFVGTWHGRKRGRDLAAEFTRDVLPAHPDAQLRMVTRDAPADPGPNITVLGEVSDTALTAEYQRCWVFCLPSDYEGFGIPYAEAMACGAAVVATPNPGARYVLEDGRAGALAPLGQIGTTVARLVDDRGERERLSAAGLARCRDLFALDGIVDAYEELYRSPAGAGRAASTARRTTRVRPTRVRVPRAKSGAS